MSIAAGDTEWISRRVDYIGKAASSPAATTGCAPATPAGVVTTPASASEASRWTHPEIAYRPSAAIWKGSTLRFLAPRKRRSAMREEESGRIANTASSSISGRPARKTTVPDSGLSASTYKIASPSSTCGEQQPAVKYEASAPSRAAVAISYRSPHCGSTDNNLKYHARVEEQLTTHNSAKSATTRSSHREIVISRRWC